MNRHRRIFFLSICVLAIPMTTIVGYCGLLLHRLNTGLANRTVIAQWEPGQSSLVHHRINIHPISSFPQTVVRAVTAVEGSGMNYRVARSLTAHTRPGNMLFWHLSGIFYPHLLKIRATAPEVLELFLNRVYIGENASKAIYGLQDGARFYFDKPLHSLSLSETALLIGIIRSPSYYSPVTHPERAHQRQGLILDEMAKAGLVSAKEANSAKVVRVVVVGTSKGQFTGKEGQ